MRTSLRLFFALALPVIPILAACGTDRESGSPVDTGLELTGIAEICPSGEISDAIAAIFPTANSLRHVAKVNCGQVFDASGKGKQTEAVQKAFARAAQTVRNMRWFQVIDTRGHIENNQIAHWQVTIKIGFTLEDASDE